MSVIVSLSPAPRAQPPRSNPFLRSSSAAPPFPSITPSTVTCVIVISFIWKSLLARFLSSLDPTGRRGGSHRSQQLRRDRRPRTASARGSSGRSPGLPPARRLDPLADLLGEPDEKSFGPPDVAEPIHVFVLDHFTDELRAVLAEPGERVVNVVQGEHDAEVAESVHRSVPVIGDRLGREKSRELEAAVAVRRAHHGDLDALVTQSSDAPCPLSFDHSSPFELEAELG